MRSSRKVLKLLINSLANKDPPGIKQVLDIIIKDQAPSFMKMLKMLNVNIMPPNIHPSNRIIAVK